MKRLSDEERKRRKAARNRAYYIKNREKLIARTKEWYQDHKEALRMLRYDV